MQIRLLHTEVPKIQFDKINPSELEGFLLVNDEPFNLDFKVFADKYKENIFAVFFKINLTHHREFRLSIDYLAWFEASGNVKPDFIESPFARINAPAIAFPYLRSFVSLLTLNSGYTPAILPAVNFIEMQKAQNAEKLS